MATLLAEGVWWLDVGVIRPYDTNAFLVDDGTVTLVDTGLWRNCPSLASELADAGYAAEDVDRVLLTHYHLDHTGGLSRLAPAFDGPVYLGAADVALYTEEWDPPWTHPKGLYHRLARRLFPLSETLDVRSVEDGARIGAFTAYHTPGHNPGQTAYVHDSGAAFVGDLVWGGADGLTTPVWLDSYDVGQLKASAIDLLGRAPPFAVLAMGHGDPITADGDRALRRYVGGL